MLVLFFKETLQKERIKEISNILRPYATLWKFNQEDVFLLIFVYFANSESIIESLIKKEFPFLSEFRNDEPFFVEGFGQDYANNNFLSFEESSVHYEPPEQEQKPIRMKLPSPITPPPLPMAPEVEMKLDEQFKLQLENFKKSISAENNRLKTDIMSEIARINFTPTTSSNTTPSATPQLPPNMNFNTPQMPTNKNTSQNMRLAAKNEMIANGLRCELCQRTLKGEAISGFLDSLRHHSLEHFNVNFPSFKRFKCREHPEIITNFVSDIEGHLKRHDQLTPLPERRKRLVVQYMSNEYLKTLAETCNKCFPEVFEKDPMDIRFVELHATPQKAKLEVFPLINREFCIKNNINDKRMSMRRTGNPVPVINLQ